MAKIYSFSVAASSFTCQHRMSTVCSLQGALQSGSVYGRKPFLIEHRVQAASSLEHFLVGAN